MKKQHKEIFDLVVAFADNIFFNEKKNTLKVGDSMLYPAEIHLMLHIEDGLNSNITRIAESLGITKGALSQKILNLEKKGMIIKEKDPYNKNELSVYFTPLGKKTLGKIKLEKQQLFEKIDTRLKQFNREEKRAITAFMNSLLEVFQSERNLPP